MPNTGPPPQPAAEDLGELRARILELFERHREQPGAAWDETRFLDHLLARPKRPREYRDRFAGLRRLHAFLDAVQLECAVCYSIKDREADYSLDGLVRRTAELAGSRKASLASLRNLEQRGFGTQAWVVADVLLFPLVAAVHRQPVALGVVAAGVLAVNAGFAWLFWRYRRYNRALRRRLES